MNSLDKQYQELLQTILDYGVEKKDRTGTGTRSIFGYTIRHKMSSGFPLLTTKKMAWKTLVTELLWFLRGDTDIRFLWKNNCTIWDGDWYKHYKTTCSEPYSLDKMKKFALAGDSSFHESTWDLGPIYGKQWRSWIHHYPKTYPEISQYEQYIGVKTIDQIANLISELKTNPDSRRLMVSAWHVGELDQMVLPPCHYGFQVYTREQEGQRYISLMWNQRSVDTFLGLPFNIASYGLLLEIIAKEVNMVPDELIGNLGDVHIYSNHIEQAKEQIGRDPYELPKLSINTEFWQTESGECGVGPLNTNLRGFAIDDFIIENYQSHPAIKAPLSN